MSDSGLRGVVVSHGAFGESLVHAVRAIAGAGADGLIAVTNDGCNRETLAERVRNATGDAQCVVFVDLPGGSCFQAAAALLRHETGMAVVAGVNLAMLLDFVNHRDETVAAAAARAVSAGQRAIRALGV